jgi:hypothetical protein
MQGHSGGYFGQGAEQSDFASPNDIKVTFSSPKSCHLIWHHALTQYYNISYNAVQALHMLTLNYRLLYVLKIFRNSLIRAQNLEHNSARPLLALTRCSTAGYAELSWTDIEVVLGKSNDDVMTCQECGQSSASFFWRSKFGQPSQLTFHHFGIKRNSLLQNEETISSFIFIFWNILNATRQHGACCRD